MRKNSAILFIVIISVGIFFVLQFAFSTEKPQKQEINRAEDTYYQKRVAAELEMQEQGIADAVQLLENLKDPGFDISKIEKEIKTNLQYCLDNFSEMTKGDNADIEKVKMLSYSLSFIYNSVINCDYDRGKVHTENEKKLWKTNVYQFVSKAYGYFLDCNSLTQQKEDYIAADKLAKKLDKNLNEETKLFVDLLSLIVKEGA